MNDTPARDERGQALSVLVVGVVVTLLLVAGLVVDGGAKASAVRRAQAAAAQAARAAVDAGAVSRSAGASLDVQAVRSAARAVLVERGVVGDVEIAGGVVTVRSSDTERTLFLTLLGITELTGTGEASAGLEG